LFVEGAPRLGFIDRLPRTVAVEVFVEAAPDRVYPSGWWVARVWLEPAPAP